MNAVQLLREQFKSVHDLMEATVSDLTDETANFTDTGKALSAGAAYAHAVLIEDTVIASMLMQKTPLSADTSQTGLSEPSPTMAEWDKYPDWTKRVKVDIKKFSEFAKKVYRATDEYLATIKDEDLDKEMDLGPMGKHTLSYLLNNFTLLHFANLTGEVSAAKGIQGLKGYPF